VTRLVERGRAGGLAITLTTAGDLAGGPLPVATAYRVVQEALTNAARHAPGSSVEVRLAVAGDRLMVEVRDDGRGPEGTEGAGFGLVGLAERVRAEGGSLTAGPQPGGGFALAARLPLRSTPASPGARPTEVRT